MSESPKRPRAGDQQNVEQVQAWRACPERPDARSHASRRPRRCRQGPPGRRPCAHLPRKWPDRKSHA
ncbi:hypothetical protein DBR41_18705, partial [Pseudomonas sp. HMWF010]